MCLYPDPDEDGDIGPRQDGERAHGAFSSSFAPAGSPIPPTQGPSDRAVAAVRGALGEAAFAAAMATEHRLTITDVVTVADTGANASQIVAAARFPTDSWPA